MFARKNIVYQKFKFMVCRITYGLLVVSLFSSSFSILVPESDLPQKKIVFENKNAKKTALLNSLYSRTIQNIVFFRIEFYLNCYFTLVVSLPVTVVELLYNNGS